jgi:hypothetical protein
MASQIGNFPPLGGHVIGRLGAVESQRDCHGNGEYTADIAMSTHIFARDCHGNREPHYAFERMATERRRNRQTAKYAAFGRRLEKWRGKTPLPIAASRAGLGESTLRLWEGGHVGAPDPLKLVALARIYDVPVDDVFAALAEMRGVKLPPEPHRASSTTVQGFVSVPVLDDKIAAGPPLFINESEVAGEMAFAQRALNRLGIARPICVVVGRRELSMWPTIHPNEVVLLDCSDDRRLNPRKDSIYAVNVDGGATLKRILVSNEAILLVADNPDKETYPTREIRFDEGQALSEVVIGEVMWWGEAL